MSRRLSLGAFAAGFLVAVLPAFVRATTPLSEFDVPSADLSFSTGLSVAAVALAGILGTFTDRWPDVLISFGVIGFAVTFAP